MKINVTNLIILLLLLPIASIVLAMLNADTLARIVVGFSLGLLFPWLESKDKGQKDGKTN